MSLENIVKKLGGDIWAGGGQANIPGPGHSATDRSISLRLGTDGRVVVNSWGRSDWRDVLNDLRDRGLIDVSKRPVGVGGRLRSAFPDLVRTSSERLRVAQAIWTSGASASERSLTGRHARLRRVERPLPGPEVLRHSAEAPLRAYDAGCRRTNPAMLVAVCDKRSTFTAVEMTFLDPNADRSRRIRLSRKTVGLVPPGSAVRIDEVYDEMVVGKGFFTSLSGTERFNLPGWALLSTRNVRRFTPPGRVRRLVTAADRGQEGEQAATFLAERARSLGVRVWIEYPPLPHRDWNEAAEQKAGWLGLATY